TGGLIGDWSVLVADHGRVHVERFHRIDELNTPTPRVVHASEEFLRRYGQYDIGQTWQNVNMSPDFPTVGGVIADLFPQSGGQAVDGVIAVDPPGLASILRLTGPVRVPGWPDPVTADNVVDVTLRDSYERFAREARHQFLGDVAERAWTALTSADLGELPRVARAFGEAARG